MRIAAKRMLLSIATCFLASACGCADTEKADSQQRSFMSPPSTRYSITQVSDDDDYEEIESGPVSISAMAATDKDTYKGTARKAAKTSIVDAPVESFDDVRDLIASLPPDREMIDRNPGISRSASSDRVDEELRNVRVDAFLYAATSEDDNDFHLILGSDPDDGSVEYLNVELSGLPTGGPHRSKLKRVRDYFKWYFGDDLPGSRYDKYTPPIPVRVTGSIFYDISHRPGVVGPSGMRPETSWEIHPITFIEFEP